MEHLGQTKVVYVPTRTEVWGSFTAMQKINLDKRSAPCKTNPDYSYTQCMMNYVASTAGCHLNVIDDDKDSYNVGPCVSSEQVMGLLH